MFNAVKVVSVDNGMNSITKFTNNGTDTSKMMFTFRAFLLIKGVAGSVLEATRVARKSAVRK